MIQNKKPIVFGKFVFFLKLNSYLLFFLIRFICGKTIFLFNFISINKNDEFLIANNSQIHSFLQENQKQFTFLLGNNNKIRLDEIFDQLKKTQIYFDT
jgi:hypothetical protein